MGTFEFLERYIIRLPDEERNDHYLGYVLKEGKNEDELGRIEAESGILVPGELKEFYQFSYGALLHEYEILTIPEIVDLLPKLRSTYEEYWIDSIFPFAYVRGVGDVIAFDLNELDDIGRLLILDGFHELPPTDWKGICNGLRNWLIKMTHSGFQPFWMK